MTLARKELLGFCALTAAGAVVVYWLLATFGPHVAHAAVVASTVPGPATAEPLGWVEYLGIGLAALAGVRVIVDTLLAGFTWLAPRTKTTADDTIRDDLKLAHDKLDTLAALVGDLVPSKSAAKDGVA